MNIYLISGLGADRTVFRNLTFSSNVKVHYLDWIAPLKNESLRSYALRLAEEIDTTKAFSIIGLSFGGMLATEIASEVHPHRTVLISSVLSGSELPWYYRLAGRTGINKWIPVAKPKTIPRFISAFFGVETPKDALAFHQLMENTDPYFSKWAIDAILHWKRTEIPSGIFRIHGGRDKVLPMGKAKVDYLISDGSHFMVFNRAEKISEILIEIGIV